MRKSADRLDIKTNIGRQVLKLSRLSCTLENNDVSHEGFNSPPVTPRVPKSQEWKLGSGFVGAERIIIQGKRSHGYFKAKAKHSKKPRLNARSLHLHKISTQLSPTERRLRPITRLEKQTIATGAEFNNVTPSTCSKKRAKAAILESYTLKSAFAQEDNTVRSLTTLLSSQQDKTLQAISALHSDMPREPEKKSSRNVRIAVHNLPCSPCVRAPSKSERNGWLKRRRMVNFADDISSENQLGSGEKGQGPYPSTVQLSCLHGHTVASSRQLEVQDSQEFRDSPVASRDAGLHCQTALCQEESSGPDPTMSESCDLGQDPRCRLSNTAVNNSSYFSNAVQQLSSLGRLPRNTLRRMSRSDIDQESDTDVRLMEPTSARLSAQQGEFGRSKPPLVEERHLKLGMTKRLRRTMSSVPCRPPFKEPFGQA